MNFWLSLLIGISVSVWVYSKYLRRRTPDGASPLIASAIICVFITIVLWVIANILIPE